MIRSIKELHQRIDNQERTKKLVLASAADEHSLEAVFAAKNRNIIEPILVGDTEAIKQKCQKLNFDLSGVEIVHTSSKTAAVLESVKLVKSGKADILMKGHVSTADLLRGVLNKEWGLQTGSLLSHFALMEIPRYHKMLGITDVAMNIAPTLKEKTGIVKNAAQFMVRIGYETPKVAVIGAVEVVNEKMPATIEAAVLAKMSDRSQLPCLIDGPLALDNALSKESAKHKGIESEVAGDADILLMPDIEAGNVLYKSFGFLQCKIAAVILGAAAPIVLTSRSDTEETKLNSIVLAALS
ncbi:MAG: phosphate butyryltransferase [Bacteroidia bacterium]|nr:MAG: phosphate butyryltransferase [Bacteroidia bacterium]